MDVRTQRPSNFVERHRATLGSGQTQRLVRPPPQFSEHRLNENIPDGCRDFGVVSHAQAAEIAPIDGRDRWNDVRLGVAVNRAGVSSTQHVYRRRRSRSFPERRRRDVARPLDRRTTQGRSMVGVDPERDSKPSKPRRFRPAKSVYWSRTNSSASVLVARWAGT